jgi:deoxyribodipyrimidine photolyase-related protein
MQERICQIILYNQLGKQYLYTDYTHFLYIHNTWKIHFQGRQLNLNTHSKIVDYAGWKQLIDSLHEKWKNAEFFLEKSFILGIRRYATKHNISEFVLVTPVEEYVYKNFIKIRTKLIAEGIKLTFTKDEYSFFLSHDDFRQQYKKPPIMEYFYRFVRKKENILMTKDGKPEWGEWNYDKENRKFDRKHERSWDFKLEKNEAWREAEEYYDFTSRFTYPTNRQEALKLLWYFLDHHLDNFGRLEDAMYQNDAYVHHSLLSSSINYGLLTPREVVKAVVARDTAMNNKEWFIRQVLWWREYMYHFFHYYTENFLNHTRPLPEYFWKNPEDCAINSLRVTLQQVHKENMSHHIQRLMIIGNFALLCNLDPHELNHWFFEYYTDAFEWVVTPNVLGMSQFADGWKLATKPYVASANYIHKMSDYYKNSEHNPKEKYTDDACPFNYLYWCFVVDNKETFEKGRQQFVVKNLEKVDIDRCRELKENFIADQYSI